MTASAVARRSFKAPSAALNRRSPSKVKGILTKAMTKAPRCLATSAITGEMPAPVPPPRLATMKISSKPSTMRLMISRSSSAAFLPSSVSPPVPRPRVRFRPTKCVSPTGDSERVFKSVFTQARLKPSRCSISMRIRSTALLPAPPAPMILMRMLFSKSALRIHYAPSPRSCLKPLKIRVRLRSSAKRESSW